MLRSAAKTLYHRMTDRPHRWYPVLAVYYLTYRCELRCSYCSDGHGRPYPELDRRHLPARDALKVLRAIRKSTEYVVITGGEPLAHPEVDTVLRGLGELAFRGVVFTTSGLDLAPHLDAVQDGVTELVFSVDTLDRRKADRILRGPDEGTFERILESIAAAADLPGRRFDIVISCVLTPETVGDALEVADWATSQGFQFAAAPQLVGVKAHPDLHTDPRYRRFWNRLIERKRRGDRIHGAIPYLEGMRDLAHFQCRPFTMLVVSPLGEVFYPCLERGRPAGNLLETDDLHAIRREGARVYGPKPQCDTRCQSACALGFATLLDRPMSAVEDAALQLKGKLGRWRK